ncbi:MAG: YdeI/OmpD-associated family protein [Pyrinomonadaceae bacterium]
MPESQKFVAEIYKIGINPVVDPPADVLDAIFESAGRSKGPIQVRGKLNGAEFAQTLVKFRGAWRLYINGEMLRDSNSSVGDRVQIEIEFDPRPREIPMPKSLHAAFENDTEARKAFAELTPSRQKEIFRYINSLRTEASIARNVERILEQLKGIETVKPLAVMRLKKRA